MEKVGVGLIGIGVVLVLAGFAVDSSVATERVPGLAVSMPERVVNLQMLGLKSQLTISGIGAAIVGAILFAAGQLGERLDAFARRAQAPSGMASPSVLALGEAGDQSPPPGYYGMFKFGRTNVYTNKEGRAWVAGRDFDSADAAKAWLSGVR